MQVISAVKAFPKSGRMVWIADSLVKINTAIRFISGTNPCIHLIAERFPKFCIGSPSENREQCAQINTQSLRLCNLDIHAKSVNQFFRSGQIAPGAKWIDVSSYWVYDIVDAVLDNHCISTGNFDFSGKARLPF